MREIDKAVMKERFHEAFHKARKAGVVKTGTDFGSTYTMSMLRALKDMAEHEVWPDGRFGDDDCNVWSLFHRYDKAGVEKLRDEIKELRKENAELLYNFKKIKRNFANCAYEKVKFSRELETQKQVNSELSKQNGELLLEREALKAEVASLKEKRETLASVVRCALICAEGLHVDDDCNIVDANGEIID